MTLTYALFAGLCGVSVAALVLVALELGRRVGTKRPEMKGMSAVEGAVFGLMGLLLAFTFSGAAERFDGRRRLVVEEANAIGTAYRRVDLLPAAAQPALRRVFRQYVEARLNVHRALPDLAQAEAELARSEALEDQIWSLALPASYEGRSPSTTILIANAFNQMFDIANTRTSGARIHPPFAIYLLLTLASVVSGLLAGFGMGAHKARSWIHLASFSTMLAVTVYVIIDLEYPRIGLIRIDAFDRVLRHVRQEMEH